MAVGARYERLQPRRRSGILGRPLLLCATLILLLLALGSVSWGRKDEIQTRVRTLADEYGTRLADKYGTRHRFTDGPSIDWTSNLAGSLRSLYRRPAAGSAEWHARYPGPETGPAPRADWARRLAWAHEQRLIAEVPQAKLVGGLAEYPESLVLDDSVCSYRRTSCIADTDIWRGPQGTWAINFDDGLIDQATHFYIGDNVKTYWQLAKQANRQGSHLAVHTWTHAHLTTRSDSEIIGELGWTMQIIFDLTGHIPRYYRPPYGDVDARVRSLAEHVLGLKTVIWNYDSEDWSIDQTHARGDFVDPPMGDHVTTDYCAKRMTDRMGSPHPMVEGIMVLEHELSNASVSAFIDSYPDLARRGWASADIASLGDLPWYQ